MSALMGLGPHQLAHSPSNRSARCRGRAGGASPWLHLMPPPAPPGSWVPPLYQQWRRGPAGMPPHPAGSAGCPGRSTRAPAAPVPKIEARTRSRGDDPHAWTTRKYICGCGGSLHCTRKLDRRKNSNTKQAHLEAAEWSEQWPNDRRRRALM